MTSLGVVYLLRGANSTTAARRFRDSYKRNSAGIAHELIVLLKGFKDPSRSREVEQIFQEVPHRILRLPDKEFDIGSYLDAAAILKEEFLCFLNSHSMVRADHWLEKLYKAAVTPGVGLVGATGSWQSIATDYLDRQRDPVRDLLGAAKWFLRPIRFHLQIKNSFAPFPNAHVRTNAFLIKGDVLLQIRRPRLRMKLDTYRFESGLSGFSKQIQRMGLLLRVVGNDGIAYAPEEWPGSRTFWCGKQENQLVSDNQTRAYDEADARARARYRRYAWQDHCGSDQQVRC